jgi:hypothetical protein
LSLVKEAHAMPRIELCESFPVSMRRWFEINHAAGALSDAPVEWYDAVGENAYGEQENLLIKPGHMTVIQQKEGGVSLRNLNEFFTIYIHNKSCDGSLLLRVIDAASQGS